MIQLSLLEGVIFYEKKLASSEGIEVTLFRAGWINVPENKKSIKLMSVCLCSF